MSHESSIGARYGKGRPVLSFEVFPPKKNDETDILAMYKTLDRLAALSPDFVSVTYGAGGSKSAKRKTAQIAQRVEQSGVTALAHLTCASSSRAEVSARLEGLRQLGIENILALRGDLPPGGAPDGARQYQYASELVAQIKEFGGFCVGGACYPDGHVDCQSQAEDLQNLKIKVQSGCDFLITQMFFDNAALYSFLYRAERSGIHVPVIAGVMPVTNAAQIARICQLSGTTLPTRFRMIVDKFGGNAAAMKQAGIAYATEQIVDLIANGIPGVHVYTMNKPDVAAEIAGSLSAILG